MQKTRGGFATTRLRMSMWTTKMGLYFTIEDSDESRALFATDIFYRRNFA